MSSISTAQKTKRTEQYIENLSFDETYGQSAVEILGEDSGNAALKRLQVTAGGLLKVDLSGTAVNAIAIKVDGSAVTQPVSGTFWQATQPVSIATMPSTPVTGTFWQATQPVSAASLPLPSGAATSALQGGGLPAALGAGGGLKIDGSGTALPVSGTVTETNSAAIKTAVENLDNAADTTNNVFVTAQKKIAASTYAPTRFADLGANATVNVKSSAGNVFSLYCNNENAADRYIQLHNTATTPSAAAVPLYTFRIPGGGDVLIGTDFFTNEGANFTTGIAFAFSTTKDTYTAGTATDHSTIIHYI